MPIEAYSALGTAEEIRGRIEEYVAVGASKFVLRLACPEVEARDQLVGLAQAVAAPITTGAYDVEKADRS